MNLRAAPSVTLSPLLSLSLYDEPYFRNMLMNSFNLEESSCGLLSGVAAVGVDKGTGVTGREEGVEDEGVLSCRELAEAILESAQSVCRC